MRVAMVGLRGVPATFGGVERAVEELGAELCARGHEVTVFCRSGYGGEQVGRHRGMRLRHLPAPDSKHLEALVHTGRATLSCLWAGYDIVHFHALGPGVFTPAVRWLSPACVVQTVHGLDHERAKWGSAAQRLLTLGYRLSARVPDATIVVSAELERCYRARWRRETWHVPNGVRVPAAPPRRAAVAERHDLRPGRFVVFVGRLVPEKRPDLLLEAFASVAGRTKLVLAGESSHTDAYATDLEHRARRDRRVVLTGYVYGDDLAWLYANAAAFVLPSDVEGLPLTLLEAAAHGCPVVASAIPPHAEVLHSSGPGRRLFQPSNAEELCRALAAPIADPGAERRAACALRRRVVADYSWPAVAAKTESVYESVVSSRPGDRGSRRPGGARPDRRGPSA